MREETSAFGNLFIKLSTFRYSLSGKNLCIVHDVFHILRLRFALKRVRWETQGNGWGKLSEVPPTGYICILRGGRKLFRGEQ